ncbi:MAG: WhiB family transcriptional regulator [Pseudonocardia sp.]|nr:WhiB family transcriptional regulator [Pseudonocardia sp.]
MTACCVDESAVCGCTSEDPNVFFAESPADLERAKDTCRQCAGRHRCLADALARGEPWGVWGGEILVNGVVVGQKRARGRPRKHERVA